MKLAIQVVSLFYLFEIHDYFFQFHGSIFLHYFAWYVGIMWAFAYRGGFHEKAS